MSRSIVEGDEIPYQPWAAARKKENLENWLDRDPELKCFLPGVPRAMYLPYPFQIVQGPTKVMMIFEFADASRTIHLDRDTLLYEATIEDNQVFTRPWKMSMPLYRRLDKNARLMEFQRVDISRRNGLDSGRRHVANPSAIRPFGLAGVNHGNVEPLAAQGAVDVGPDGSWRPLFPALSLDRVLDEQIVGRPKQVVVHIDAVDHEHVVEGERAVDGQLLVMGRIRRKARCEHRDAEEGAWRRERLDLVMLEVGRDDRWRRFGPLRAGEIFYAPPNVLHWHGATPGSAVTLLQVYPKASRLHCSMK